MILLKLKASRTGKANLGDYKMINELIKLATHLDKRGLTKEADYLDQIIKISIGPSSHSDKILTEYGLTEEHYINTPGDPYKYVYIPDFRGRGPVFLITEGKINTKFFDAGGNATKTVSIKRDHPAFEILKNRLPDHLKPEEESGPVAQEGLAQWKAGGWTQFRNADGTVAHYIDDRGSRLDSVLPNTVIGGRSIAQVGSKPLGNVHWVQ